MGGTAHHIGRGDHCIVPRGAAHHFINTRQDDARVLSMLTPARCGPAFFREAADVVNAGGPPDSKKMAEVMLRHGLVPVPPAAPAP